MARSFFGSLGRESLGFTGTIGHAALFLGRAFSLLARRPFRMKLIVEQIHFTGNRSVVIVVLTSAFTGLVLTLQGFNALLRFGAESMVGALVALSLVRELAPVLAALMITARAGSAMAATLGNMRVTDQLDALQTMAIDPMSYVVVPRLWSSLLVVPLLTALFTLSGLFVAQLFAVHITAGVLSLGYLSLSLGGLELAGPQYPLRARFSSVGDLEVGDPVKLAGVRVGDVTEIQLVDYTAEVQLSLRAPLALPEDSIASIQTAGLLGRCLCFTLPAPPRSIHTPTLTKAPAAPFESLE